MKKSKFHVGLEIGTTTTRMVVAEVRPDQSVKILGVGESKTAGVRKGEIVDQSQVKACIKDALLEAEDTSDVVIRSVFLAVTGGHISGENNRGSFRLPEHQNEVTEEHVLEVEDIASDTNIQTENAYIHTLVRTYWLDGQEHRASPAGLYGKHLEADFHLVHGIKSRIQNSIKVVRECAIEVEDIVFAPIASAQISLTRERKEGGALVIDLGGGTTDYALYLNNAIYASGCIPLGGDHVTNDLHLVHQISQSKAEKLKIEHGDVDPHSSPTTQTITVEDEVGLQTQEIDRSLMNRVISARYKEIFKLLCARLPEGSLEQAASGIYLTGGASGTKGLDTLAQSFFNLPVKRPEQPEVSGPTAYFKDPHLFTVLGLIRYAQILEQEEESNKSSPLDFFGKLFGK